MWVADIQYSFAPPTSLSPGVPLLEFMEFSIGHTLAGFNTIAYILDPLVVGARWRFCWVFFF